MAQNWNDFINALYIEEYDKLIRIAYHMTGNQELAEDLVQETFVLAVCQRQPENVDFRRNEMTFFAGQHEAGMQP